MNYITSLKFIKELRKLYAESNSVEEREAYMKVIGLAERLLKQQEQELR